jgi:phosphinothricin acetyltransferase
MQLIRPALPADAPRIGQIYNHHVRETIVTFEELPVADEEMARRIADTTAEFPWLVLEIDGSVAGYAYASTWKRRSAYRFTVESTIYLAQEYLGRGLGAGLYGALIGELRSRGLHSAIGGISLPNPASIALHERLGFRHIGQLREVGWKFGKWVDVGYWQLLL